MDTLRTQDTLDMVLKNYLGLFFALRGQDIRYIVLVNFSPEMQSEAADFEAALRAGLPSGHELDIDVRSTVDLCRLLREVLPESTTVDCNDLQYPSVFAQDPFVALRYDIGFLAMLSSIYSSIAFSYSFVADAIAQGSGDEIRMVLPTNYTLVGGNILAQRDWAIVGLDTLEANLSRSFTPAVLTTKNREMQVAQVTEDLAKLLGVKEIFWTGTDFEYPLNPYYQQGQFQPAFHIDFYLTPVGPVENPTSGEWEELIFVGELATYNPPTEPDQEAVLDLIALGLEQAAEYFSNLVSPAGLPFRVVRIPLLLVGVTPQREAVNKLLSWNQVLVQSTPQHKTIFMPNYIVSSGEERDPEFARYQKAAISAYEAEGFQVTLVDGRYTDYSYYQGGSLHCIAKVMDREEVDLEAQT